MVDASNSAAVVRSLIVPGKASWRSCGGGRAAGERAVDRRYSVESSFFSRLDHSTRCIVLLSGRQNECLRSLMTGAVDAASSSGAVRKIVAQLPRGKSTTKRIAPMTIAILTTSTPCLESPSPLSLRSPVGGARRMQLSLLSAQSLSVGQFLLYEILRFVVTERSPGTAS